MDTDSAPRIAARYRAFGGFRFGLALLVVAQHYQHLLPAAARRTGFGAVAVAVFFAISGFVVTEANSAFYAGRPMAFLGNRILRLLPPYLAALAVAVAVHALLWRAGRLVMWDVSLTGSPLSPSVLLAGVLGIVPGFHARYLAQDFEFIPFAWTLRVEMAFYLSAAATLGLALRWRRAVEVALGIGLLAASGSLLRARPSLLNDVPMFLIGVALYMVLARPHWDRMLFGAAACVAGALGLGAEGLHGSDDAVLQFALLGALMLGFAWLAVLPTVPYWRRIDRSLGDLSYPLYLNHYVVGIAVFDLWPGRGWAAWGVALVVALLLAWTMSRLVDMPLQRLRDRVRGALV